MKRPAFLVLCALLAGCGSGGKKQACTDACAQGESQCENGRIRQCAAGAEGCLDWSDYSDCAEGLCESAQACGEGPPEITRANLAEVLLSGYCRHLLQCAEQIGPSFQSVQACVGFFTAMMGDDDAPVLSAADNPLLAADLEQARACYDQLASAACTYVRNSDTRSEAQCGSAAGSGGGPGIDLDRLLGEISACAQTVEGTLAENDCCDARGGCGPGLACEVADASQTGVCLGPGGQDESCYTRPCAQGLACRSVMDFRICQPVAQLGQECSGQVDSCAQGLYCDPSLQTPVCVTADRIAGQPCECLGECAPGLYCDQSGGEWVCAALKQEGAPCADSHECALDLMCYADACRSMDMLAYGDECPGERVCPGFVGGTCADDGTGTDRCQRVGELDDACDPQADLGESCALTLDLICDPATSTCRPLPGLDAPCEQMCAGFLDNYCAYADPGDAAGTCRPRVGVGQDCSPDSDDDLLSACELDLECDPQSGTCVSRDDPLGPTCR